MILVDYDKSHIDIVISTVTTKKTIQNDNSKALYIDNQQEPTV